MFIGFKQFPKKNFEKFPRNTLKVALTIYNYNKQKTGRKWHLKNILRTTNHHK